MRPISGIRFALPALALAAVLYLAACDSGTPPTPTPIPSPTPLPTSTPLPTDTPLPTATPTTAATATPTSIPLADRKFVPVLCYHHVRAWEDSDTEDDKAYIVQPNILEEQLKYLKDNGYHGVNSKDVYEYYALGKGLPDKPILLSFDDNDENQYTNALPLLKKYGFTATFFIMTVTIDKENYMTSDQLKDLDKQGFDLEPHTWDHHMVTSYKTDEDWQKQLVEPKKTLEDLLGHETPIFAYPFGLYNAEAVQKLKEFGYKAAFRLREVDDDTVDPVFAIKRYIANGFWDIDTFSTVVSGGWEQ